MNTSNEQPKPMPQPVGRSTRIAFFAIGAFIIVTILLNFGSFDSSRVFNDCKAKLDADQELTALKRGQKMAACLNERSGLLAQLQLRSIMSMMATLPNTPCDFVGVWNWTQPTGAYRVTLGNDGEFVAAPVKAGGTAESDSGSWSINKQRMVWFHNKGQLWPPEINLIENQTAKSFTLVGRDGARSQFDLIEATKSQACPRP